MAIALANLLLADKKFVAKAAIYARTREGVRSVTHLANSPMA